MSISEKQIALVQESFEKVVPIADQAADIFYNHLFKIDASLRELFPKDMAEQKKKLMQALTTIARGLNNLDKIVPIAQELGKRHVKYNVKPEHYTMVGNALLCTLADGLGDEFTSEVREAWVAAYKILADVMKEASYGSA